MSAYQCILSVFLFLDDILPTFFLKSHPTVFIFFCCTCSISMSVAIFFFTLTPLFPHILSMSPKQCIQDTLKKRMQVQVLQNTLQGVGSIPQYDNVWHCIRKTYSSKCHNFIYMWYYLLKIFFPSVELFFYDEHFCSHIQV